MNIALVTNTKLHHKYWVSQLCESYNVKLIVHPSSNSRNIKGKLFGSGNLIWSTLKLLSVLYNKFSKNSYTKQLSRGEEKYFKSYEDGYNRIDKSLIHFVETINDIETIRLFKNNNIDVVCFLGGDIVKKQFFDELDVICLNYHSGISPYYNGNKTVFHAVSDFRPNFAGGTLMVMNEKIDGGAILSHYLTSIEDNDTASDLFLKGIKGAVVLYTDALNNIENIRKKGISQDRSIKYVRNLDWTIINDIRLNSFYKSQKMKLYSRPEEKITYYNNEGVKELYALSLSKILAKRIK